MRITETDNARAVLDAVKKLNGNSFPSTIVTLEFAIALCLTEHFGDKVGEVQLKLVMEQIARYLDMLKEQGE